MSEKNDADLEVELQAQRELNAKIAAVVEGASKDVVVVGLTVFPTGDYSLFCNAYSADRPTVYQALGLLERLRYTLLASIPPGSEDRDPEDPGVH